MSVLRTARLDLEPLRAGHAAEMVAVLADPLLYTVTGGGPPSLGELRERYRRQVDGPRSADERWCNWVLRDRGTQAAVGYVQATVRRGTTADLAWLVGVPWQGNGYAREGAAAMVDALVADGVTVLHAHVAPGHAASERVARSIGMAPTDRRVDGEVEWERIAP